MVVPHSIVPSLLEWLPVIETKTDFEADVRGVSDIWSDIFKEEIVERKLCLIQNDVVSFKY